MSQPFSHPRTGGGGGRADGLAHLLKCLQALGDRALKVLILVALGRCHLLWVTSIPPGRSPQVIDRHMTAEATELETIRVARLQHLRGRQQSCGLRIKISNACMFAVY